MDTLTFMENNQTFHIKRTFHFLEKGVLSLVTINFDKYLAFNLTLK